MTPQLHLRPPSALAVLLLVLLDANDQRMVQSVLRLVKEYRTLHPRNPEAVLPDTAHLGSYDAEMRDTAQRILEASKYGW